MGKLTSLMIVRLFNGISPSFNFRCGGFRQPEWVFEAPSPQYLSVSAKMMTAVSELRWPAGFEKKVLSTKRKDAVCRGIF
jgi:hypothetical protein